jgi:hypothetical protein
MSHNKTKMSLRNDAICIIVFLCLCACNYDDQMEIIPVKIQLVYPDNSIDPYTGARVELTNTMASTFVDSTDATGTARFAVPPGVYSAASSSTLTTTDYRYFFNGTKSQIIISSDSINTIQLKLTMSKKRIVN